MASAGRQDGEEGTKMPIPGLVNVLRPVGERLCPMGTSSHRQLSVSISAKLPGNAGP